MMAAQQLSARYPFLDVTGLPNERLNFGERDLSLNSGS